jgi:phosphate-selective porin OprO/OprP
VYFQVWYVMGSLFLTGEHRAYRTSTGVLERVIPRRDFLKREGGNLSIGPGAWELAVRFSHVDLNSGGITGGRLSDITLGVNWYLNPYCRITSNYIHAYQSATTQKSGPADFWGIRFNYDF